MAALRHGVHTVIIPKNNERDLEEIDPIVRKALNFVTAETIDTVLATALNTKPAEMISDILTTIPEDVKQKSRKPGLRQ